MNLRNPLLVLGLSLASSLAFAQTTAPAAAPAGNAAKPAAMTPAKPAAKKTTVAKHVTCKAGETLVKGKCEAKKAG